MKNIGQDPTAIAAQAAQAAQQAAGNVTSAATNAASSAAGAAGADTTGALTDMGVPPDTAAAAGNLVSSSAMSGFKSAVKAIGHWIGHIHLHFGHHKKIAPAVAAVRATLPASQHPGFDAAVNLAEGHASGNTPPANLSPQAKAAWLMTHGMVANKAPGANVAVMQQIVAAGPDAKSGAAAALASIPTATAPAPHPVNWLHVGLGAAAVGGAAAVAGLAAPLIAGGAILGAGVGYLMKKGK